eukprot:CAMPEP_0172583296 /NCGR_PEP_ID=MMETSP1068-20121228/2904_1 /TAXON_ID=35684 /ORGANISM="Pseudopedinella elastica, Strain CCMP716" /LENGTH=84 /DNA_ID=CAMNT_0013377027 /DNA_START=626 /DNA_END=882 /DNA_ORIENTATION=-
MKPDAGISPTFSACADKGKPKEIEQTILSLQAVRKLPLWLSRLHGGFAWLGLEHVGFAWDGREKNAEDAVPECIHGKNENEVHN